MEIDHTIYLIMLTATQKLKILQSFICLISVNAVCKSGLSLNKDGKERQAFNVFEAELSLLNERRYPKVKYPTGRSAGRLAAGSSLTFSSPSKIILGFFFAIKWSAYTYRICE